MPQFVEVAVNVPAVSGVFHYHLPEDLQGEISPGQLVVAPFGHQTVQGVVLRFVETPQVSETKAISAIVDEGVVLTRLQITLAEHLAGETLASLAACIGLMLPSGVTQLADAEYELLDQEAHSANKLEQQIIDRLAKRGALRGRQLNRALPKRNWQRVMRELLRAGVVQSRAVLPRPRVRPKYIRTAQLAVPPEFVRAGIQDLGRTEATQTRRAKMLHFLAREGSPVDVSWVYAESGGNLQDLRVLSDMELVMLREEEAWRDPLAGLAYDPSFPPELTLDQRAVWGRIKASLQRAFNGEVVKPTLLHGVTGSGKTEIYLRAMAETLKTGKQAIVLVPEIALTPQTVRRIMARFPGQVGLLHSGLSDGERYDTWRRARMGRLPIIVGPRSALFAPLPDPGLIVVDESHDDSYYQDTQPPYYHARTTALQLAKLSSALCILGTATPDVTSYQQAQDGQYDYLQLPARILAHRETVRAHVEKHKLTSLYQPGEGSSASIDLPQVQVVDMRGELRQENRSIFSRVLQAELQKVLDNKQQAILFLNRRGAATYVFCRDCGHVLDCPNCEMPLTYHRAAGEHADLPLLAQRAAPAQLLCHHCGYQRGMPKTCPQCGGGRVRHYGSGTQRVEDEVKQLFPSARTLRWDYETTREKGAHEIILSHFSNQRADILIGTQMLAKGLDLPLVTLVGVVLADVGLTLPDYRANERVFQVLTQVAGRAGRSPLGGQVILQTFDPDHPVIQAAAGHDYAGFVQAELAQRERLGYPPFKQLVRLEYRHLDGAAAEEEATRMGHEIRGWLKKGGFRGTELIGPAPCFYARLGGEYRWQIILRGPQPRRVLQNKKLVNWRIEVNPQALL